MAYRASSGTTTYEISGGRIRRTSDPTALLGTVVGFADEGLAYEIGRCDGRLPEQIADHLKSKFFPESHVVYKESKTRHTQVTGPLVFVPGRRCRLKG